MRVVGRPEEVVGLDQLEALVHQRRRVDRDLAAHRPGRVRERLLDRDVARARRACARGTGRRDAVSTSRSTVPGRSPAISWCSAECSESTGMICAPVASASCHDELAADDERLLVGQREVDALAERRRRSGPRPARADERVEHEVGAGLDDEPTSPSAPASTSPSVQRLGGARGGVGGRRARCARTPCARACSTSASQRRSALRPTSSRSSRARDDVERLGADRAGRAEDEEPLHRRPIVATTI